MVITIIARFFFSLFSLFCILFDGNRRVFGSHPFAIIIVVFSYDVIRRLIQVFSSYFTDYRPFCTNVSLVQHAPGFLFYGGGYEGTPSLFLMVTVLLCCK